MKNDLKIPGWGSQVDHIFIPTGSVPCGISVQGIAFSVCASKLDFNFDELV